MSCICDFRLGVSKYARLVLMLKIVVGVLPSCHVESVLDSR